jgi:hypothetical protein
MSVGASCFLAWLPEEGAAEILTNPPTPIVAGTLFPGSQAIPVAGGYRLRGQWPFVTGSHEGHWFLCLPQILGLFAQPPDRVYARDFTHKTPGGSALDGQHAHNHRWLKSLALALSSPPHHSRPARDADDRQAVRDGIENATSHILRSVYVSKG